MLHHDCGGLCCRVKATFKKKKRREREEKRNKETLFSPQCFSSNLLTAMERLLGPEGFCQEETGERMEKQ